MGNRHFCCQSWQHLGFNGQLAPRPLICALPKPTLVSGKPAKHATRGRLVSSLWKSFTTSKLGSDHWRSTDCGGRRAARASMVLYIDCRTGKNSTLPRTCRHHVELGVILSRNIHWISSVRKPAMVIFSRRRTSALDGRMQAAVRAWRQ